MPIYEYRCNRCAEVVERLEHLDAPRRIPCPELYCGGSCTRIFSKGSFVMYDDGEVVYTPKRDID